MKYLLILLFLIIENMAPVIDIPSQYWDSAKVIRPQVNPLVRTPWSNEQLHSWPVELHNELTLPGVEFLVYNNTSWDYRRLLFSKSEPIRHIKTQDEAVWTIDIEESEQTYLQIVIAKESKWAGSAGPFTIFLNDVPTRIDYVVHPGDIFYIGYPFGYFVHSKILDDMFYPVAGHPPLLKMKQGMNTIRIEDDGEWAYGIHIRVGQAWILLDEF